MKSLNLMDLKDAYASGAITKREFTQLMSEIHASLEMYPAHISGSPVSAITINAEGDRHDIPFILMDLGEYEAYVIRVMREVLGDDDVIFDVGANIGWYGINLELECPTRRVFYFEPMPQSFAVLEENLTANGLSVQRAFNLGLYEEDAHLDFFFNRGEPKASSLRNIRDVECVDIVTCEVQRLDNFVSRQELDRLDFMKCDVEGAELFVFRGGLETIEKFRPIIFTEMLRKWSARFDYHPNEIISLLCKFDYVCFGLSDEGLKEIVEVDDKTVQTNFLFLHPERHANVFRRLSELRLLT